MKIIGKLFNILVYAFLTFAIINGVYLALPFEIQAELTWYSQAIATINAVWSGVAGLGGGALLNFVNKAKTTSDEKYNLLAENYFKVEKETKELKQEIAAVGFKIETLFKEVKTNNKLLEADLQAKLSNPLIDKKVEEIIKEAIENEK